MTRRAAVFVDRDGTIMEDRGYLADPDGVRLLPGAPEALARLSRAGFALVLVTNQSGVNRGLLTMADVHAVNRRVEELLLPAGVVFADVRVCPHRPDENCTCRKPNPGMILEAARHLDLDPARSYMIGDKPSDAEAGRAAGCRTVCVGPGPCPAADMNARGLIEAADWILADARRREQQIEEGP